LKKNRKYELNSIILLILSLIAGAVGYFYHIILANLMSTLDYGEVNSLLAYVSIGATFISPVVILSNRKVAIYCEENKKEDLEKYINFILGIGLLLSVLVGIILYLIVLFQRVSYDHKIVFLLFLITSTTVLYILVSGILQGTKKFFLLGSISIVNNLIKVFLSAIFLLFETSIYSVLTALIISNIVCIILIILIGLNQFILIRRININTEWLKEIIRFYGWSFLLQFYLSFICNGGELLVIKNFFLDENLGIYSVASTLTKIPIFAITPLTAVMFTEVAGSENKLVHKKLFLYKTLFLGFTIVCLYLFFLNVAGSYIINIVYGNEYINSEKLLRPTSLYTISITMIYIVCQYYLAINLLKKVTFIFTVSLIIIMVGPFFITLLTNYIYFIAVTLLATFLVVFLNLVYNITIKEEKDEM